MTNSTYNLETNAQKIGKESVQAGKSSALIKDHINTHLEHCQTVANAESLVTAIYKAHTASKVSKEAKAAAFSLTKQIINKLLKATVYPFSGKTVVSAKTPDKKTGKCPITAVAVPKGGKGKKRAPTKVKASKVDQGKSLASDMAKNAGVNYDDRMFAVQQVMSANNINASDLIPELFAGLTPQGQQDCIIQLKAAQLPMASSKIKAKKTNHVVAH